VSRKNPDSKNEPPITEAVEKAELLIRRLQGRLAGHAGDVQGNESAENLEFELEKYFAAEASKQITTLSPLHQIRKRVVERVAEKVLNGWEWSQDGRVPPLENEVIERLAERVFERLTETDDNVPGRAGRSLSATKSPARQVAASRYS
jgi:hypothetical protein